MNVDFCDVSINSFENKEIIEKRISTILNNADYISGNDNARFEEQFAQYIGKKYCVGVANGTDALEIAIDSLQLPIGSKILVQGNSYIATALAVINQRNQYVIDLVDVNENTNMIDINDLEKKESNATLLIITHLFGFMPTMGNIIEFCKENNLYLIEDCAQAHGATWNHQKAGNFGIISCFSFYPTKNLGAFGDGGAILTNESHLYQWIKRRANMGSVKKNYFEIIGRNSRLDTIQAAVLSEKLTLLDKNNQKRRQVAHMYNLLLQDVSEIKFVSCDECCIPVYHLYVIRAKNRDKLQSYLKERNITTLVHYPVCIGKTEAFSNVSFNTPICEELSNCILSLPMYPNLINQPQKIQYVVTCIKMFYGYLSYTENSLFEIKETINTRGILHAINHLDTFITKRIFYINGFQELDMPIERGNHCNYNTNELLLVLDGSIFLELEDVVGNKVKMVIEHGSQYYIQKNTWIIYHILDRNTNVVVLCDTTFEEQINITDYHIFKGI